MNVCRQVAFCLLLSLTWTVSPIYADDIPDPAPAYPQIVDEASFLAF